MQIRRAVLLALGVAGFTHTTGFAAEDEFALGVRTTAPLSPSEQAARFQLPPGFEIQLVATEPDINKPMNLQFDAAGRLWVTTSIEYPFPAPANRKGRDRVMIFEDFGPDGKARKVTQFADGLNIPIGVYPFRTDEHHWKAIVWSIPYLWLLEDTDGDGVADKRTQLYGPFDHTRDTHGNQASFRRGFDGWLYATHGFNNDSHVTARDGSHVDLNSGNTYRIRLDGSRIEQHTHGQVNPFGLAWDARGNLYSSDCHSAPIYQLLTGGYYPSFGKPHDGLGFAPVLMEHAHGSTAIDGAFYYNDNLWPAEFQDNFFIGNVMTSRLNRDHFVFDGSSPRAVEQPDFLTTTDPWFRPVDNHLGPDGALYVADFYNRIIGHYEVPLTHPGRDRERGRIWRVVYKGTDGKTALRPAALATSLTGLIGELGSPNLTRRMLAMSEIQDRFGAHAVPSLNGALTAARSRSHASGNNPAALQHVHLLWLLERLGGASDAAMAYAGAQQNPLLRTHAMRILADRATITPAQDSLAVTRLKDPDALVARCAAEVLGAHPAIGHLRPLLDLQRRIPAADTHLAYVVKKSLRDHLRNGAVLQQVVASTAWTEDDRKSLLDVAVAVSSPEAAVFLSRNLELLAARGNGPLNDALLQVARHAPESELPELARFVRNRFAGQTEFQLALFKSVDQGLQQRGTAMPPALREWGSALAHEVLGGGSGAGSGTADWSNIPLESAPTDNPWDFQERTRTDGKKIRVLSSLMRGEQLTGVLRSPEFKAGAEVSFWICGHDGYPDKPAKHVNAVRLRHAKTGAVLFEAEPPRSDVAKQVTWNTTPHAGTPVVLEVSDRDTGDAYAWLAIGEVTGGAVLPAVAPRAGADRIAAASDLASRLGLKDLVPGLTERVKSPGDPLARAAAARALAGLDPAGALPILTAALSDDREPETVRERFGATLAELNSDPARAALVAAMKAAPFRLQTRWATALTGSREGAEALLEAVSQGAASARLLQSTGLKNRLQSVKPRDWESRVAALTRDLAPADAAREKLIADRRTAYQNGDAAAVEGGRRLFEQNCAACHQIEGKGGLVGPQLTGVGNRGLERLCEDILDPNRNVDRAFRQTILTLKDGDVQSGLFRREEGDLLVFADGTGKEFSVKKGNVTERRESDQSLMPDNFGESIPAAQFNQLLAYLLSQRLVR
jgi:putative heme-binding domain-containing protein